MRDGLHWLRHDRFTRVTVLLSAGTTLICQALIMIFLTYAHGQHLSSVTIGVALAASGLGGALGSAAASRLPAPTRRSWTVIRILAWSASVVVLVISGGRSFVCLAFVMAVLGFTGALGNVELGTYLINNAPGEMLARATSIGRLLSFGACALGPALGGEVIQEYGIRDTALLLSVAIFILAVISLFLPSACTGRSRAAQVMETIVMCAIQPSYASPMWDGGYHSPRISSGYLHTPDAAAVMAGTAWQDETSGDRGVVPARWSGELPEPRGEAAEWAEVSVGRYPWCRLQDVV